MICLFFGPPGSGKGTQAESLVNAKNFVHVSTGDLFRMNIKNSTPIGVEAKSYMDKGHLVPDSVVIKMVEEKLKELEGKNVILDGFPRTIPQAEELNNVVESLNLNIDKVFYFNVEKQVLINRLSGRRVCKDCGSTYHLEYKKPQKENVCDKCSGVVYQRKDDFPGLIKDRLQVYDDQTSPLISFYSKEKSFVELKGNQPTEVIFKEILSHLG